MILRLLKVLLLFFIAISSLLVLAKPVYFNSLRAFYSGYPEVKTRRCQNCHSKSSLKLNDYGKDFASIKSDHASINEAFMAIESLDSDGDGISNLQEFIEGAHPGEN